MAVSFLVVPNLSNQSNQAIINIVLRKVGEVNVCWPYTPYYVYTRLDLARRWINYLPSFVTQAGEIRMAFCGSDFIRASVWYHCGNLT